MHPQNDTTGERWRPVVGYEGCYEVSDHGRVRSLDRRVGRKRVRGQILKTHAAVRGGYASVSLWKHGRQKTFGVHKLVLTAFVGPRPEGMMACHHDDDPQNNHLSNLRWDTSTANHLDMVRNGNHFQVAKVECPFGHPLVAPNLTPAKLRRGWRECRACSRGRSVSRKRGVPYDSTFGDAAFERITGMTVADFKRQAEKRRILNLIPTRAAA